jgi:hypothetical protein
MRHFEAREVEAWQMDQWDWHTAVAFYTETLRDAHWSLNAPWHLYIFPHAPRWR